MPDCLIIDDEESIVTSICEYFNMFEVSCEYALDYESGLRAVLGKKPRLIVLDVNLGGQSGFGLCKAIRESTDAPVLFISARNTEDDVLMGLGAGGDDYISKPFSMAVLLAKVKAMLRRNQIISSKTAGSIKFGNVDIDTQSGRVIRAGNEVKLKPMELKLLIYLTENKGRRLSKDELLEKVWGDTFIGEGSISVHIRHLREKLEPDPKNPRFIKTMWGSGYMFEDRE